MRESHLPEDSTEVGVKGSIVRAVAVAITEQGLRDAVLARVSPAARTILVDPPVATMWIDARLLNEVYQAIFDLGGADKVRRLNRSAVERGVSPLLRATAERVLRIFGASPGALLSKLDRVAGTTARGVVYHYAEISAAAGHFDVEYPTLHDVPVGPFLATGGALEIVFDMCSVRGSFGEPAYLPNGRNNSMRFTVSWRDVTRG
jgi:hypothetical protein